MASPSDRPRRPPGPLCLNTATTRGGWTLLQAIDGCARHGVTGIEHVERQAVAADGRCHEMVNAGNILVPCGKAVGDDGVCEAGHRAA